MSSTSRTPARAAAPASARPTSTAASKAPTKAPPKTAPVKTPAKAPAKAQTKAAVKPRGKAPATAAAPARQAAASPVARKTPAGTTATASKAVAKPAKPLNAKERDVIEQLLLRERAAAMRATGSLEAYLSEEREAQGRASGDVVDVSNDYANRENATVLASRGSNLVREIDEALRRLRAEPDRLGICTGCEGGIGFERLEVLPTTRFCKACARPGQ